MNIAVISFTQEGCKLAADIAENLTKEGHQVTVSVKCRSIPGSWPGTLGEWTGQMFRSQDALIYVGAVGIAVRSIAPFVQTKKEDPAVLVIDEKGTFCIPVLSGHIGGANELALLISRNIQAQPVITTATDLHGKWAVDVFAAKNGLYISDMKKAKEISAAVLAGRRIAVNIEQDGELRGGFPPAEVEVSRGGFPPAEVEVSRTERPADAPDIQDTPDIQIGIQRHPGSEASLYLIPQAVILGIGCKKGTDAETVEKTVNRVLDREGIRRQSICKVASIDLKAEERGLLEYCRKHKLAFEVFSKEELMEVPGTFTPSEFVEKVTGVDNVCERSAVRAGGDWIILRKTACEGVTVAAAVKKWGVCFE